jgi:hypothetical protein
MTESDWWALCDPDPEGGKRMTVYVVFFHDEDDGRIFKGAYSTEVNARAFIRRNLDTEDPEVYSELDYDIIETEVDS